MLVPSFSGPRNPAHPVRNRTPPGGYRLCTAHWLHSKAVLEFVVAPKGRRDKRGFTRLSTLSQDSVKCTPFRAQTQEVRTGQTRRPYDLDAWTQRVSHTPATCFRELFLMSCRTPFQASFFTSPSVDTGGSSEGGGMFTPPESNTFIENSFNPISHQPTQRLAGSLRPDLLSALRQIGRAHV